MKRHAVTVLILVAWFFAVGMVYQQ